MSLARSIFCELNLDLFRFAYVGSGAPNHKSQGMEPRTPLIWRKEATELSWAARSHHTETQPPLFISSQNPKRPSYHFSGSAALLLTWESVGLYSISLLIPSDRSFIRMLYKTSSSVHALRNTFFNFLIWGSVSLFFHFVSGVQVSFLKKCFPYCVIVQLKKVFTIMPCL